MLSNVTPDIQIKMSKNVLLKIKELPRRSLVFIAQAISFTSTEARSWFTNEWMETKVHGPAKLQV